MLSALIWGPAVGALLVGAWPQTASAERWRSLALAIAVAVLLGALALATQFDPSQATLAFPERVAWIEPIGVSYALGLDGLSLPLVLLNGLLTAVAIGSSDRHVARPQLYYALILALNASVTGAFLARDVLLFLLFYEIELIPLYLLIAIWGGERRGYAATKFLLYTALSGACLLAAALGTVWASGAASFSYERLAALVPALPVDVQVPLLGGFLLGFAIKTPFLPFHTWLPDAHVEASTPISILLAGILLKLGTYGLLRFGVGLFPEAWQLLAPGLAVWAAVSALYGALAAIAQTDMKQVVAYASIAHMGYILLAAAAATPISLVAAIVQTVSHGLISGLLFLLVGTIGEAVGTRQIGELRGLLNPQRGMPLVGSLTVLGAMASAGIPGMVGFVSEFTIFRGSFASFPVPTLLCMVSTGLTAVYFLLLVNRVFFGRLPLDWDRQPSASPSQALPALVMAAVIVTLGVQPQLLVQQIAFPIAPSAVASYF